MDNSSLAYSLEYKKQKSSLIIKLTGDFTNNSKIINNTNLISEIETDSNLKTISFISKIDKWNSDLLAFLRKLKLTSKKHGIEFNSDGLPAGITRLLALSTSIPIADTQETDPMDQPLLSRIGNVSLNISSSTSEMISFIGEVAIAFAKFFIGKAVYKSADLWTHIQEAGANALPIITLINFLIGIIIAFVGATQLEQFGATIFVADLVAVATVREMAPMMTAIILAGRSGAAFAAQLGTMMVNEEIDAYKTMGFNPVEFLVLPRLIALALMMPLLTLYADLWGIIGGAFVGTFMMDISFSLYLEQTQNAITPIHFVLGLLKATIYGVLVAIAGCLRGIQCGRSASAVGTATTSAVVTGIVFIITACAITTIIFNVFGY